MQLGTARLGSAGQSAQRHGFVTLAKLGHAVKGIVYLLIGVLALQVAATGRGKPEGKEGAVRELGEQPFGDVWLVVVGIGLSSYALWSLVVAITDSDRHGAGLEGIAKRIGHAVSGLVHGAAAFAAFQLAFGAHSTPHEHTARTWIGKLLQQPWGEAVLVAVGAGIVIAGIAELVNAVRASFERDLDTSRMSARGRQWVRRLGRVGHAAHGVVLSIVGVMLVRAALDYDPRKAKGLGGALREIQTEPYGATLLAIVAVGLAAYGLFTLLCARYQVIRAP
jgi:hypothetical protein